MITERIQRELLRLRDATHALIRRAAPAHARALLSDRTDVQEPARPSERDHLPNGCNGKDKEL